MNRPVKGRSHRARATCNVNAPLISRGVFVQQLTGCDLFCSGSHFREFKGHFKSRSSNSVKVTGQRCHPATPAQSLTSSAALPRFSSSILFSMSDAAVSCEFIRFGALAIDASGDGRPLRRRSSSVRRSNVQLWPPRTVKQRSFSSGPLLIDRVAYA